MERKNFSSQEQTPDTMTPPMLVHEIARLAAARMRAGDPPDSALSQHGCRLLLMALLRGEEKEGPRGLTQCALCRETHLSPPTVSTALRRMESEGLVRRCNDKKDARARRILLTDAGHAADRAIRDRLDRQDAILMEGFTEQENLLLHRLLLRMRENILRHTHPPKGACLP